MIIIHISERNRGKEKKTAKITNIVFGLHAVQNGCTRDSNP